MKQVTRRSDGLPLALQVARMLQDDMGAVVREYDVDARGAITLDIRVAPHSWRFKLAHRRAVIDRCGRLVSENKEVLARSRALHTEVQSFIDRART